MKLKKPQLKFSMKKPDLSVAKLKQFDYKGFAQNLFSGRFLLILLVLLIVLVNYLSLSYFIRLDATDAQLFSLSPATKSIVSQLSDEVVIEVYFSDNIPPNLLEAKQNVLDMLEEFEKASKGKIRIDVKNPAASDFETSANMRGIQQIQYSEYADDKFSVAQGFLGIAFVKGDEVETIPVITSLDNLEYEVVSRILKLTKPQEVKIGFFTKFQETGSEDESQLLGQSVFDGYSDIRELIERQYLTGEVDLSEGKPIDPEEFPVVVVVAPKAALSQRDFFELEQFLFKGGRLLVLEDLLQLTANTPTLNKTESNLNDFLKNYGVEVETKVLLDESFTPIISQNNRIAYPFWVLVGGDGINSNIPPLNEIESVTFLWANPLKKEEKSGLEFTELFTTTEFAWVEEGEFINIDFQEFSPSNQKKYTISYLVEGEVSSQFTDSGIPELGNASETDARTKDDEVLSETDNLKIVVIGDADFVSDNFMGANEQNPAMFLNLIDWLSNSDDLSSIRSKSVTTRPLETLDNDSKNIYKVVNSAAAPLLVALSGFVYLKRRKNRQSAI